MSEYASATKVAPEKSRAEIEKTLSRYGAKQYGYAQDAERGVASISFNAHGRYVRFVLNLPLQNSREFTRTSRGSRAPAAARTAWEQACRQKWRALALCVKAKLETVRSGISTFETEFLANIVLPNGDTVGQLMQPQIAEAYETGGMPAGISGLLPAPRSGES